MLMTAGLGTRLRPFTDLLPKPLFPVMGVPVAQFALDALAAVGVSRTVCNAHHLADACRAGLLGLERRSGMDLVISDERALLLGSAGGIRHALSSLGGGPFFLFNGDILCGVDLAALASAHSLLRERAGVAMTLAILPSGPPGEKYREVLLDRSSGLVSGLGELGYGKPYFAGVAVLEREALEGVPETGAADFVSTVLRPAIERSMAGTYVASAPWYDIGSPELWLSAHLTLVSGLETGGVPEAWRRRIESGSIRVGSRAWMASEAVRPSSFSGWAGPCYWSGSGAAPEQLGPRAVLYGEFSGGGGGFRDGIGYGGIWLGSRC